MSGALESAAAALEEKFAQADFQGIVEFEIEGEGIVRVEHGNVSTGSAGGAEVVIAATLETFRAIFDGELSPTAAYMTGRMRIDGDMSAAMRLSQILG